MKLRQSGFSRAAAEALGSRAAVTKSVTAAIGGIGLSERVFTHPIDLHFFNIWGHLAGTFLEQLRVQDTITSFLKDSSKDFTFILLHLVSLQFIRQHFLWKNTDHLINNSSLSIFSPAHTHRTPSLVLGFIALNSSQRSIGFHNATLSRRRPAWSRIIDVLQTDVRWSRVPLRPFLKDFVWFQLLHISNTVPSLILLLSKVSASQLDHHRTCLWNPLPGIVTTEHACGTSYLVLLLKNLLVERHLWFSYYRTFLWNVVPGSLTKEPSRGTSFLVLLLQNLLVECSTWFSYQRTFSWNIISGSLTTEPSCGMTSLVLSPNNLLLEHHLWFSYCRTFLWNVLSCSLTKETSCGTSSLVLLPKNLLMERHLLSLSSLRSRQQKPTHTGANVSVDPTGAAVLTNIERGDNQYGACVVWIWDTCSSLFSCSVYLKSISWIIQQVFLTSSENESDTDSEDKEMPLIAEGQQTK
ncbi:Hypothetical protein SMAX5B_005584 [Scophthalmus maximus]|uniref:Uncharacterized protein n=1 Tax=Scophthalmus maximus TaxID=52904 RepID=A0A2U9BEF6_SCOMX|nr:Hypothetical protein SMAX5B_005584 [Scophthalmus maximus]